MPATRPVHHQGRPGGRGCPGVRGSLSNTAFASSASVGQGHTREGGGWRPRPGGRSRHHRPRGLQAGRPGPRPRRGQCLPQVPERLLTVTSRGGRGEGLRGVRHEDARPIVGPHPQDLGTSQRPRRLTPPRRGSGVSTWIWGHGHWVCKRLLDHFGLGVPRGQRQRRCPPGSWKLLVRRLRTSGISDILAPAPLPSRSGRPRFPFMENAGSLQACNPLRLPGPPGAWPAHRALPERARPALSAAPTPPPRPGRSRRLPETLSPNKRETKTPPRPSPSAAHSLPVAITSQAPMPPTPSSRPMSLSRHVWK